VSDGDALQSKIVSRSRRLARVAGVLALAGSAMSMVANALTIRDRAVHTGEASAAPGIATASWIAALICSFVLLGLVIRIWSTSRRPSLPILWIAGLGAIAFTYLVHMATASLWV
jgi:hypothetical protein